MQLKQAIYLVIYLNVENMELNEQVIKEALRKKGVTAKDMCKEIGLSETALYRFYANGGMRVSTEKKIKDFLNISLVDSDEKISNANAVVNAEHSLVESLLNRIQELSIENFRLREKLGKFDSTLFALSA